MKRLPMSPFLLTFGASAWMAIGLNFPLWRELKTVGLLVTTVDWMLAAALAVVIAGTLTALVSLVSWRWTQKPIIAGLLLVSAAASYFMWTYHVVIDPDMAINVLQTDAKESLALLNPEMLGAIFLLGIVPTLLLLQARVQYASAGKQAIRNIATVTCAGLTVIIAVIVAFQPLSAAMRNHKQLRYLMNPLNAVYAVGHVASKPLRRDSMLLEPIGMDAVGPAISDRPMMLILALGETARAANFSLNGYPRSTNPLLQREDVVSFRNATSCGTSTAASVPCMFSHLGRSNFDNRRHNYENVLDILHRAGFAVLWLDNQSGCKGVCDRIPSVSTRDLKDPALCKEGDCLDEILLMNLNDRIAALPAERKAKGVVLVMHQMGSHGPAYFRRSPENLKQFLPECATNNIQQCSAQELVNAYDNSIVYTDRFLTSTIGWLKGQGDQFNTAMLYVSDHGESLGENNLYLHGLPYAIAPDYQKRVPWISWFSGRFKKERLLDQGCLKDRADQALSHDNLFHSILGLVGVQTTVYNPQLDVYAPCIGKGGDPASFPRTPSHAARRLRSLSTGARYPIAVCMRTRL